MKSDITHDTINIFETGLFCGIGAFAFEGAGTIFTIRESMADRFQLSTIVSTVFPLIAFMYICFGLSFYFVERRIIIGFWK